ncbi:MAG: HemK/PrmC family methyltransferase, partial [Lachnospiraceae bacterium]|nr:HemK/PrmC family methyltransferase [Lachnospiraceae bacterium]
MSRKAAKLLAWGQEELKKSGIVEWDYDSRELLSFGCQVSKIDLILNPEVSVSDEKAEKYKGLIERRALREPLQYLIGEWEFMGLPFLVNTSVLIPRQDTETLIEYILERETETVRESCEALDVCTGSGCIAVSLAVLGHFHMDAVDISKEALLVASQN